MAKLSWVDPTSFEAVKFDTPLLYFTKFSGKYLDFYFLVGTHLKLSLFIGSAIHYSDVIMGAIKSQITSLTSVYSIVYSDADQRKHQSSASLAFVRGIHRGPVNSPHKWTVTRKMFSFDDVIMRSGFRSFIFSECWQGSNCQAET